MKKIGGIIIKSVAFLALSFTLLILITSKVSNSFGIRSFVVLTGSMQPIISQGSIIFTQQKPFYNKGDIIAFQSGTATVTHRIVEVTKQNTQTVFQTKGDANNVKDDNLIPANDIYGKQIITIPYVGLFLLFLKTAYGFVAFILFPAFLYITFEIFTVFGELGKKNKLTAYDYLLKENI